MEYLAWFDDIPKRTAAEKIRDAMQAWENRYGTQATTALVNVCDAAVEVPGVEVRVEPYIRVNNYGVMG